jgi:hypothetical protein
MPRRGSRSVWRIAVLWQGTVLDVVTLDRSRTFELRTGERITARVKRGVLVVDGVGEVDDGEMVELSGGSALVATNDVPEANAGALSAVDGTLFHAAMIGAAVQACVVSALVLAPAPSFDSEPGAGLPGEWRRALVAPGGTAPLVGAPMLSAVGRKPDEMELPDPVRKKGPAPKPSPVGKQLTVEEQLAEMNRVLHLGDNGTAMKDALGDLARAVAHAPVAGADVGGLAPKDPVETNDGNGLIGVGKSQLAELIHRRIEENDKKLQKLFVKPSPRAPIEAKLAEMAPAVFTAISNGEALDPAALDPGAKDEVRHAVQKREMAVQACYESRGLASDRTREGRLELRFTLLPSGRIQNVVAQVDNAALRAVADCVRDAVADWYLGDGLVEEPTQIHFPFILKPKQDVSAYDFDK